MVGHPEAGPALDAGDGLVEHASRHFRHPAAGGAPNVLVVGPPGLVPRLAVTHLDPIDEAGALKVGHGSKDGREVGRVDVLAHGGEELVEGPGVVIAAQDQRSNGIGNRAGPGHVSTVPGGPGARPKMQTRSLRYAVINTMSTP